MEANKKLREYLDSHGITQAFLVKKTGLSHWVVSNIMNGKRRVSADELGKISQALNVSADIFLKPIV